MNAKLIQRMGHFAGSKISFQVEDALFSLVGGATKVKNADGTYAIIDHEALKKKAVIEAKEEKLKSKEEKVEQELLQDERALKKATAVNDNAINDNEAEHQQPTHTLTHVAHRSMAMPERTASHNAEKDAVTV